MKSKLQYTLSSLVSITACREPYGLLD